MSAKSQKVKALHADVLETGKILTASVQSQHYVLVSMLPQNLQQEFDLWRRQHNIRSDYVGKSKIAKIFDYSVSTAERRSKEPDFPHCIRTSGGLPRWRAIDIFLYKIRLDLGQL